MKKLKLIAISLVIIILSAACSCNYYCKNSDKVLETEKQNWSSKRKPIGLEITSFIENAPLKNAGAKVGDVLIKYDNEPVTSLENLGKLKFLSETDSVEVMVLRDTNELTFTIPKGQIGVYLKKVTSEHPIDPGAITLEGYGPLGWGIGMENSFMGSVKRINDKLAPKISYDDLVGLSGYGFRLQFFDGWCPSSPDATCGKDVGSMLLENLGYEFEVYALQTENIDEDLSIATKTKEELQTIIKENIDAGYPVIGLDMIATPEWGIITGYQAEAETLFCRTYFDKTSGYEIAKKFPWLVFIIKNKNEFNIKPLYKRSLRLAKELYNTPKYDNYFSGTRAIHEWVKALQNQKYLAKLDSKKLSETEHANWWIYYSLFVARDNVKNYLTENIDKFDIPSEKIRELIKLYSDEIVLLEKGFENIPSPFGGEEKADWNSQLRERQILTLTKFLGIEEKVKRHLNSLNI